MPKILIIEDEPLISLMYTTKFKQKKYTVFTAMDGKSGLSFAMEKQPDMILLDLVLPGMSGYDILKELKKSEATRDIPVIITSNLGQDEEIAEGKKLGAVDYVVKSLITPAALVEKVDKLLE